MRLARWGIALLLLCETTSALAQLPLSTGRRTPYASDRAPSPTPAADAEAPADIAIPPQAGSFSEALALDPQEDLRPAAGYHPPLFGDLPGSHGTKRLPNNGQAPFVYGPIIRHTAAIKVADNEGPRPANRLFYSYGEFSRVNADLNPGLPPINLQRHLLGFEKTLLDGWASVGLRLPVVVAGGPPEVATQQVADLTIVAKVALWDDRRRGRLLSSGLLVTVPTGPAEVLTSPNSGNTHRLADVVLQPFAGYVLELTPRLYVHGFSSVAVPTDTRDAVVLYNDVALGAWLYRGPDNKLIQGVAPTVELHVNTPLNRRDRESVPIGATDSVNMTCGGHIVFRRSTLGAAVGFPLTGPKPYGVAAMAQYLWHY